MKFYTGQGDEGKSTFLCDSAKTNKNDPRFIALGSLDELNSYLGVCKTLANEENIKSALKEAQENLFIIQAELGGGKNVQPISGEKIEEMERQIDSFGKLIGPITKFTIPGGEPLSAHFDYARALARRAERNNVAIKELVSAATLAYLNRLSSLLFVLARYVNKRSGTTEDHPSYK